MHEIEYMIKTALGHKSGERICLIKDDNYRVIATEIMKYCAKNDIRITEVMYENKPYDTQNKIKEEFLSDSNEIIILALKKHIWHTNERRSAKYEKNKRLINILHPGMPCESYNANIENMNELGVRIHEILKKSNRIKLTSLDGTNLTAEIPRVDDKVFKIFCETGKYDVPKSGGDYPAGEVGFGPIEGSVNGTIAYNYKIQHVGRIKKVQLVKVIEDKIIPIYTSKKYKELISSHPMLGFVSEISIGINAIWTETDNIDSIIEEKNLGTVHIGHGGNKSYGNRDGPHFDAVLIRPTLYINDIELIKNGVFNVKYLNR